MSTISAALSRAALGDLLNKASETAQKAVETEEGQCRIKGEDDTTCLEDLDLEPDEAFKQRLREICGLIITVCEGRLYFLHQTAREFLLASSPKPTTTSTITTNWANKFSTRCAHEALAEACTVYLSPLTFPMDSNAEASFVDYCAKNWGLTSTRPVSAFSQDSVAISNPILRVRGQSLYYQDKILLKHPKSNTAPSSTKRSHSR